MTFKDSDSLRAKAVISLGPALEYAYTDGFEDAGDVPISENKFHEIQESLGKLYEVFFDVEDDDEDDESRH